MLKCLSHDLRRDAAYFDIHLEGSDAAAGAGDLEVHVAIVVLGSSDVGEDGVLAIFHDQAHGDAGNRRFDGNTSIHQRQGGAADAGHGARTIRLQNVRDDPDGIRKKFLLRNHFAQRAFGQRAVSDLAAARAAQERHFADAEWREIVVQHEPLVGFAFQHIHALDIFGGAERRRNQGLRLAAGEQRRAMRARQQTHFATDRADGVIGAAVRAAVPLDQIRPENALFDGLENTRGRLRRRRLLGSIRSQQLFAQRRYAVLAFEFGTLRSVERFRQTHPVGAFDGGLQRLIHDRWHRGAFLDAHLDVQLLDLGHDLLDGCVPELNGFANHLLGDFLGDGFDHHDGLLRADHHDVQQAGALLGVGWVDDQLPLHQAHAHGPDGVVKRNVGQVERRRRPDHADHIRVVIAVG